VVCVMTLASTANAQGPFLRLGMMPPFPPPPPVPNIYLRPPVMNAPIPPVVFYHPGVQFRTPLGAAPQNNYSAARIAMPGSEPRPSNIRPSIASGRPNTGDPTDLRPGMVLPDGSIVVSVGPPMASSQALQQRSTVEQGSAFNGTSTQPGSLSRQTTPPGPIPSSISAPHNTRSILEAEEIPRPAPDHLIEQQTTRKF
jgi:hypothetical protein